MQTGVRSSTWTTSYSCNQKQLILGFLSSGYDAASWDNRKPTFRRNLLSLSPSASSYLSQEKGILVLFMSFRLITHWIIFSNADPCIYLSKLLKFLFDGLMHICPNSKKRELRNSTRSGSLKSRIAQTTPFYVGGSHTVCPNYST